MRALVVVVAVLSVGCPPPPAQPSYYSQGPSQPQQPGYVAAAPPPTAACQDTLTCYSQCEAVTEACMQTCDQRASPQDAQAARAVIGCMQSSGCQDQQCIGQRCSAQIGACSQQLAQYVQQQPQQPQQPYQPAQPAQPARPVVGGGFDLAYQLPAGWSEARLTQGAITLQYVKQDMYSPADYKLHIFPTAGWTGGSITNEFQAMWQAMVTPSFETTQPVAPYRRRLASGYALAYDYVSNAKLKQNGQYTPVSLYLIYTDDRYVAILATGINYEAEPALSRLFDSMSIRGVPPAKTALFDNAEMVGHWSTTSLSLANYVDSGGNYKGDASLATGEEIDLRSDGSFSSYFSAVRTSGPAFRDKQGGSWRVDDDTLVLQAKGSTDKRRIFARGTAPRGGTDALNLTNYGTAQPRFFSPNDAIGTSWYGKK
jgi:hypothetical protein